MKIKALLIVFVGAVVVAGAVFVFKPTRGSRPSMDGAHARPQAERAEEQDSEREPLATTLVSTADVADTGWSRFRGPNGRGVSDDDRIPTTWSETENLAWKTKLPGPGASSPILTEKRVLVTSYSGYGESENAGDMQQLKRHLSCVDRATGEILWTQTIDSEHREDPYQGMGLPEHGYATNTPVTDGDLVFAFLGKSGVIAFDLEGNEQWRVSVGTESGNRGWGTAASLILYKDMVIVNASEEGQAIIALEKSTGNQVWKAEASTLELCYSTPAIVRVDASRDDLVIAVPGEIWGMNPDNGKLTWYVETSLTDNLSPSIIVDGTTVYAFGGYRSSGSVAVKVGGSGDVTDTHVLWTSRNSSYVATPVLVDGRLHWIDDRGMYYCSDASNGELVYRARVPGLDGRGRPVYASPVYVGGRLLLQTRNSGVFVVEPADELRVLSQNEFKSDSSISNATPAVDQGQLFLRSNQYLYCVSKTQK